MVKQFKSKATGESYKIRQRIDCNNKDVFYSVECKKCGKQVVGSTEDFKSRVSSYMSHAFRKRPTCKTVQHFYLTKGHSTVDFNVIGIVKSVNSPRNPEKSERLGNLRVIGKLN